MLFEMKIQVVKSLCVKLYDVEDHLAGLLHAMEREMELLNKYKQKFREKKARSN